MRRRVARVNSFGRSDGRAVTLLQLAKEPRFVGVYEVVALVGWSACVWALRRRAAG